MANNQGESNMEYAISQEMAERIEREFTYHKPKDTQQDRYSQIRAAARNMATLIAATTPPSREQALALTNLGEAVMYANAAIARNE